jgi:hypothetical protein
MSHGVKSGEVGRGYISNVTWRQALHVRHGPEVTAFEPARIEPDYLMAMVSKKRH